MKPPDVEQQRKLNVNDDDVYAKKLITAKKFQQIGLGALNVVMTYFSLKTEEDALLK